MRFYINQLFKQTGDRDLLVFLRSQTAFTGTDLDGLGFWNLLHFNFEGRDLLLVFYMEFEIVYFAHQHMVHGDFWWFENESGVLNRAWEFDDLVWAVGKFEQEFFLIVPGTGLLFLELFGGLIEDLVGCWALGHNSAAIRWDWKKVEGLIMEPVLHGSLALIVDSQSLDNFQVATIFFEIEFNMGLAEFQFFPNHDSPCQEFKLVSLVDHVLH